MIAVSIVIQQTTEFPFTENLLCSIIQYLSTCAGESGQKFEFKFESESKFEPTTACTAVDHVNFLEGRSRNY